MVKKSRTEQLRNRSIASKSQSLEAAEQYEKDASKRLRLAAKEIAKQRDEFIKKYAEEDGTLTFSEATKLFSKAEQENWYVGLEEWISLARESARSGKYDDYLNLEYYNSQIGRLSAYQKQLELVMAQVAGHETKQLEKALELQYEEAYYKSVYNIQDGKRNYTEDFTKIDTDMLKKVVNKPWAGSDFSDRVWGNYTKRLPDMLTNAMSRTIATGGTSADIEREMSLVLKKFSKYEVHRLVNTEFGNMQEKGTLEGYIESGVSKYEWLSVLESHTCEICGKMDGQTYSVKLAKVGVNYPLIHPLCRCTTGPYFDHFKLPKDEGVRAAVDLETGEDIEIPEMSYSKWKKWVGERQDKKSMIMEFKRMQLAKVDGLPSLEKYLKLKETAPHVADKFVKQYEKQLKSDDKLFGKRNIKADKMLSKAKSVEPKITSDLKIVMSNSNSRLVGLDYKIKSLSSLSRKLDNEPDANMRDIVRYTALLKPDNMVSKYAEIMENIGQKGYNISEVKNYWLDPNNPYNGINTNIKTPEGYEFELQFHTKESFDLKDGPLHELYEKQRVLDKFNDFEAYEKLNLDMYNLSRNLKRPNRIEEIL